MKILLPPLVKFVLYKERFLVDGMTHVPPYMFAMTSLFSRPTKKLMMDKKFKWEMMEDLRYMAKEMLTLSLPRARK